MKEYVSPSRKVIKYHRSHLLESENRKHFPLSKQRAPQCAETLPAYKSHQKHVHHSFSLHPTWPPCPQECMDQSLIQIYKYFSVCFVSLRLVVNRDQKSCHFCKLDRPEVKELYSQIPQPETALSYLTEPVIRWATFRTYQQRKKDQNCLQLNSASILPPTLQLSG